MAAQGIYTTGNKLLDWSFLDKTQIINMVLKMKHEKTKMYIKPFVTETGATQNLKKEVWFIEFTEMISTEQC